MRHLSDGTLRRMYDEPLAVAGAAKEHYNTCTDCQSRFSAIADDAREGAALLAVPGVTVDPEAAFGRIRGALAPTGVRRRPAWNVISGIRWRRPAIASALAAAAIIVAVAATSLPSTLQKLFEPTQITTVSVANGDLNALAPLAEYGDVSWTTQPELKQVSDAAAAASASQLPVINPGYLPSKLAGTTASYGAVNQATGTFTFSAAKAAAAAAKSGKALPALPNNIDKSTLTVQIGPGQAAIYGDLSKLQGAASTARGSGGDPADVVGSIGPMLAIAEIQSPKLSSTGVTLATLKNYLLAQPGLSDAAKAAINSLDNPTGNLPIPIPADQVTSTTETINNVTYTEFGDNTGLGSGVVWIKKDAQGHGVIYAVAGTISLADAKQVAQNLH